MNEFVKTTPADMAAAFLKQINPDGPWSVASIPPDGGGVRGEHFTRIQDVRAWVAEKQGRENCYFISHPTRKPSGKAGRTIKTDATELLFLHADYDLDKLPESTRGSICRSMSARGHARSSFTP